jgi:hypothetical protein
LYHTLSPIGMLSIPNQRLHRPPARLDDLDAEAVASVRKRACGAGSLASRRPAISLQSCASVSVSSSLAIGRLMSPEGSTNSPKARAFRFGCRSANPVTTKTTPTRSNILNTTTSKTSGGSVGGGRGGSVGGAGGGGSGGGGPHRASRPAATPTAAAKAAASRARHNQRANLTGGARFLTSPANVEPIARKTFMLMTLNAGWVGAVREANSMGLRSML